MFIKHVHYAQLMTLGGRISVRPSAFVDMHKVASATVHKAWGHVRVCTSLSRLLPPTLVTQHKGN